MSFVDLFFISKKGVREMKSLRIELIEKGFSDARAGEVKQNGSKAKGKPTRI